MKLEPIKQKLTDYLNEKFPSGILGYGAYWMLTHPWFFFSKTIIKRIADKFKFAWQRVYRGWDDSAVWSIDYYLSKIIPEMLRELKVKKMGVPGEVLYESDFDHELMTVPDDVLVEASERWEVILDEIIEGFELYRKSQEFGDDSFKDITDPYNKAWDNFRKYFKNLWW